MEVSPSGRLPTSEGGRRRGETTTVPLRLRLHSDLVLRAPDARPVDLTLLSLLFPSLSLLYDPRLPPCAFLACPFRFVS